jgi:hypothetical protein
MLQAFWFYKYLRSESLIQIDVLQQLSPDGNTLEAIRSLTNVIYSYCHEC